MVHCPNCGYTVPLNRCYTHLKACVGAPETMKHWQPHWFVQKGLLRTGCGIPRVDPNKLRKDVIWEALDEPWVRPTVSEALLNILQKPNLLSTFDHNGFRTRIAPSKALYQPCRFYRKISTGEWDALQKSGIEVAFTYTSTLNYRLWMSSCWLKVQMFGNANASDSGGIIIRFDFPQDPLTTLKIAAHQQPGVQSTPSVVAIHREGFAELGNMSSLAHVTEVTHPPRLHHNLGFTSAQLEFLKTATITRL